MLTPARVLETMARADATRPRLTWYDDAPGPTQGERIELSAKVLANWVAKAACLLTEELDAGPGTTVVVDLPVHWRAVYWSLATWAAGATVQAGTDAGTGAGADAGADSVLVTEDPARAQAGADAGAGAVLVTLAALARAHPVGAGPGVLDEAHDLATYADVFVPLTAPAPADLALSAGGAATSYRDLVVVRDWGPRPRVRVHGSLAAVLGQCLSAWAADGSVVLVRGAAQDLSARLSAEGVTVDLAR